MRMSGHTVRTVGAFFVPCGAVWLEASAEVNINVSYRPQLGCGLRNTMVCIGRK